MIPMIVTIIYMINNHINDCDSFSDGYDYYVNECVSDINDYDDDNKKCDNHINGCDNVIINIDE